MNEGNGIGGLDRAHVWHPYTRFSTMDEEPLPVIVRGEGIHLIDDRGDRWVDAISSWWACALGHGHPRVVEAIRRQAGELQHSILGNLTHPAAARLAARLAALMPDPRVHVHFASDGASAVEAALKIALQYAHTTGHPGRTEILSLRGAYHGDTLGAVAAGFMESYHAPFRAVLRPSAQIPVPASRADEAACVAAARDLFAAHRGRVAALIVEPLCQGAAGMRMYRPEFLRALFALCRAEGALFIADEIATGFGRTGTWFAFQQAGIEPDIVCVGKALAAGYLPISAAIVRDAIHATFADSPVDRTFYHGHTFAGNPIAAAAALAALDVYEEEGIVARAASLGVKLAEWMAPLARLPQVAEVRTLGLIGAVELRPDAPGVPGEPRARRVRRFLHGRRVLSRPLGNVVYLMPPLVIGEEPLRALVDLLGEALVSTGD
ncbi:MAG: adenosylmethionine--8-amino-7-oxononanoate transaminase [Verrucomicrobia bacterium]|nr:adenosylmethionine--8-amino-7-oxononanoate transaminase [Verrucomicrobiota bacterium]